MNNVRKDSVTFSSLHLMHHAEHKGLKKHSSVYQTECSLKRAVFQAAAGGLGRAD